MFTLLKQHPFVGVAALVIAGLMVFVTYNDIARLTGNVLNRFLDPTPFEMP